MVRSWTRVLLEATLCVGVLLSSCSLGVAVLLSSLDPMDQSSTPSPFEDENLEAAVAAALGVTVSELAPEHLLELTELDAQGYEIESIEGIEHCRHLRELIFSWYYPNRNKITDLTPLAGLTLLTELDLSENRITDLAPLAGLTQLTELDLWRNEISDITPLAGLTQLTQLDVSWNPLDLSEGSAAMDVIRTLEDRGVAVSY